LNSPTAPIHTRIGVVSYLNRVAFLPQGQATALSTLRFYQDCLPLNVNYLK
jgi:hypothetical protein